MENNNIVMYLVVRESLNMSVGKCCAQTGHAVGKLFELYGRYCPEYSEEKPQSIINFESWMDDDYRKIVLKCSEKEWLKIKEECQKLQLEYCVIVDKGLTELQPNTETVIGIFPMFKNDVPKIIKKLQLLK